MASKTGQSKTLQISTYTNVVTLMKLRVDLAIRLER